MRTRLDIELTFNKAPRTECIIQNQLLIAELLLDIRDKLYGIVPSKEEEPELSFDQKREEISKRFREKIEEKRKKVKHDKPYEPSLEDPF